MLRGIRRCTCRAMGLLLNAACNRSISGVTPALSRCIAGDVLIGCSVGGAGGGGARNDLAVGDVVRAGNGSAEGRASDSFAKRAGTAFGGGGAARVGLVAPRAAGAAARTAVGAAGDAAIAAGTLGARAGWVAANSTSARCSFGVMILVAPRAMDLVSMTIMTAPTMVRRESSARASTAERESPRSIPSTGAASGSAKVSMASRTALCSSGPMEPSLNHSTSPSRSCSEIACARAGSKAARTFWQTVS